jgi:hypothetical protein
MAVFLRLYPQPSRNIRRVPRKLLSKFKPSLQHTQVKNVCQAADGLQCRVPASGVATPPVWLSAESCRIEPHRINTGGVIKSLHVREAGLVSPTRHVSARMDVVSDFLTSQSNGNHFRGFMAGLYSVHPISSDASSSSGGPLRRYPPCRLALYG